MPTPILYQQPETLRYDPQISPVKIGNKPYTPASSLNLDDALDFVDWMHISHSLENYRKFERLNACRLPPTPRGAVLRRIMTTRPHIYRLGSDRSNLNVVNKASDKIPLNIAVLRILGKYAAAFARQQSKSWTPPDFATTRALNRALNQLDIDPTTVSLPRLSPGTMQTYCVPPPQYHNERIAGASANHSGAGDQWFLSFRQHNGRKSNPVQPVPQKEALRRILKWQTRHDAFCLLHRPRAPLLKETAIKSAYRLAEQATRAKAIGIMPLPELPGKTELIVGAQNPAPSKGNPNNAAPIIALCWEHPERRDAAVAIPAPEQGYEIYQHTPETGWIALNNAKEPGNAADTVALLTEWLVQRTAAHRGKTN